ncbi:MAG: hypothetical protein IPH44_11145 [Myxococcales bacterium]|nr:hypothetical protein [Myxococcales bacterium]MBK7196095.1 hypothetical protein [Myxococcales bacterium]MBP6846007.1 hypothetical protein [Kofleriaceae bacterium]
MTAVRLGTPLASRPRMVPHYRIQLPRIAIEGRVLPETSGTGVNAMIALAYVRAWSPAAAVAIYPAGHRVALDRAAVDASDALMERACAEAPQVLRVAARPGGAAAVVYGQVDALWSLARVAQPALMARLDEVVALIAAAGEDDAIARLHREVAPLDLERDVLGGGPGLAIAAVATVARLPARRARHPAAPAEVAAPRAG